MKKLYTYDDKNLDYELARITKKISEISANDILYDTTTLGINSDDELYVLNDGHTHATQYLELDGGNANSNIDIATYNLTTGGNIYLDADNAGLILGANGDAQIYHNGTDLKLDPRAVGSGEVDFLGSVNIPDSNSGYGYKLGNEYGLWAPETTSNGVGAGTLAALNTSVARYNFALGSYSQNKNITGDHCVTVGPSALLWQTIPQNVTAVGGDALKGYSGMPNFTNVTALGLEVGLYQEASYCLYLGIKVGGTNTTDYRFMVDITDNATPLLDGHFWDGVTKAWLTVNGKLTVASTEAEALTIGAGTAGIDYQIKIDGETNDFVATWMEDEDYLEFSDDIKMSDAENIIFDTTTGTKIGTATGQKIGFWNVAPIIQPATANQAALTNNTGGSYDGTLAAISGSGDDSNINNNFTDIYTLLDEIRTALVNVGLIKGSA